MLTIMASLAQQENQSLSQNVKLGLQYRYQQGEIQVNCNRFLGFRRGENKELIIAPESSRTLVGMNCKNVSPVWEYFYRNSQLPCSILFYIITSAYQFFHKLFTVHRRYKCCTCNITFTMLPYFNAFC